MSKSTLTSPAIINGLLGIAEIIPSILSMKVGREASGGPYTPRTIKF